VTARAAPADRICIVLLTGLGDVVHGLPVVNALKDQEPRRHITWVVEPMPSGILTPHPSVDEVVVYEKSLGLRGIRELRTKLAGKRFDLTINLNYYFKSVWPTLLSRAPHRLGFDWGRSRDGVWFAANDHVEARPRRHTQDIFLEFLEHLGVPLTDPEWRVPITPEERSAQGEFFAGLADRPVVAIVPASANPKKDWLPDRYAAVIDTLEHDLGFSTVLVGGPGERENRLAREIARLTSGSPAWGLGDGIRRLVWMLEGSDLVIAPDTGPVHIARALGVPVIGLYGHTNPWRVGPYRAFEDLWVDRYTDPGAEPDPSRFDPKDGRMQQITVNDVLDRVERARRDYLPAGTRSDDSSI
jgi:heptosyltransferase I